MPLTHPIFHQIPFLRISVSFISGMLLACYVPKPVIGIGLLLISIVMYGLSLLPCCQFQPHLSGIATLLALIALGFGTYYTYPTSYLATVPSSDSYKAILLQSPVEKPKTYRIPCALENSQGQKFGSLLYLAKDSLAGTLHEGQELWVRPQSFRELPSDYYQQQGIFSSAYVPSYRWKLWPETTKKISLHKQALLARQTLLNLLQTHTDSTTYSLCAALCLGEKNRLQTSTKENFARTGASHVLAVSGLHIGIIYMALNALLSFLNFSRPAKIAKSLLLLLFLWGYAFLCGLPPSILRAVIMFSVVSIGQIFDQHAQPINTVLFTAFVLLVYHPPYLFHIGFQLSFAAVLSILLFYPVLQNLWYPKQKLLHWAWSLICVSIAAQIGTAPLTLYYFHQFPVYFLLSNFWVVPLGTGLIYGSLGLWGLSIFHLEKYISPVLNFCTHTFTAGIEKISQLPGAVIENIYLNKAEVAGLFILLLTTYLFFTKKQIKYLYGQLFMVILLLLGGIVEDISNIFFIFVD